MEDNDNNIEYRRHRDLSDIFHTNLNLQFGRLNFFLISTAFLIGAFATVVTIGSKEENYDIDVLAHAIAAAGYYLALFFTVTNLLNANLLAGMQKNLMNPKPLSKQPPYVNTLELIESEWKL